MRVFLLSSLILCGTVGGCTTSTDDQSMYLTVTEEQAITGANGQPTCSNPHKVLICHIPPGNPANEHSICVGEPAVAPHMRLHGDTIGACASTPPMTPPPDVDAGVSTGGGDAGPIL